MVFGPLHTIHPKSNINHGAVFCIGEEPRHIIMAQNALGELLGPFETIGMANGDIKKTNEEAQSLDPSRPITMKMKIGAISLAEESLTEGWEIIAVFEEPLIDRTFEDGSSINALAYICGPQEDPLPGEGVDWKRFDSVHDALLSIRAAKDANGAPPRGPGGR